MSDIKYTLELRINHHLRKNDEFIVSVSRTPYGTILGEGNTLMDAIKKFDIDYENQKRKFLSNDNKKE